eukprot:CAMPEP_0175060304 /NCGR_PEP_ID=MMETSP0052_2-20121109/12932_1 /TAXON_ID=51329 ORGANISM="Polytomella parva, Strain SAG 63-3" /NCGR_SAMPLE_ID=MMETSP0052_2 /ASSEMBLY_ACC=CAM_ASM_000194 /LENGTH=74 /DNA_ID=CAMNT_0016325987 /DNA_START=120 /DNA_END=341 /DNA_ORIENTATION=+
MAPGTVSLMGTKPLVSRNPPDPKTSIGTSVKISEAFEAQDRSGKEGESGTAIPAKTTLVMHMKKRRKKEKEKEK